MSINDKTYLAQIEGESPADRKKRLNKLAQQRYREKQRTLNKEAYTAKQTNYKRASRAKESNTVAKTPEEVPIISRLPKQTVERFNKSLDKLQEYVKTATSKELPKIKAVVGNLPDEIEFVKANKNCDDLTKLIQDRENALTEQDPNRKKIPTDKTITQTVQGVKNIYKKYSGGKDLDCADLDWVRDTGKVLDFIDKHKKWPKLSTKNQQVMKLASFLRNLEGYQKEYKIYSRQSSYVQNTVLKEMIGKNTLSDAQKAKYMDWTTLIDKLEKAWPDTTFEARALTAVYTLFAPRRTQDYSLMKVIRKKKVNESAIEKLNKDVMNRVFRIICRDNQYVEKPNRETEPDMDDIEISEFGTGNSTMIFRPESSTTMFNRSLDMSINPKMSGKYRGDIRKFESQKLLN